jgi:hypothetical protein
MRRLAVSLFALSISGLHEILYTTLSPSSQAWYTTTGASLLPLLITSILVLIAGAAFKTASVQAIVPTADPIAVVIATAQLASDQAQIQPILDDVRALTARLTPGSALSGGDTSQAAALYSRLEDYLVTKEPLRGFSRESLRARLPESFEQLIARSKTAA